MSHLVRRSRQTTDPVATVRADYCCTRHHRRSAGISGFEYKRRGLLPVMMDADQKRQLASLIPGSICLVAAVAMGRISGGPTRLDLWLAVVLYAWIGDVLLSAVFNSGRYDLGWYAGRFFGFLAVTLVLCHVVLVAAAGQHQRASR